MARRAHPVRGGGGVDLGGAVSYPHFSYAVTVVAHPLSPCALLKLRNFCVAEKKRLDSVESQIRNPTLSIDRDEYFFFNDWPEWYQNGHSSVTKG